MGTTHSLPTGITILADEGEGEPPIQRILAASPQESDPEREGIRILLACAWACFPCTDFAEFVGKAIHWAPQLGEFDSSLIASVALQMGLSLEVA